MEKSASLYAKSRCEAWVPPPSSPRRRSWLRGVGTSGARPPASAIVLLIFGGRAETEQAAACAAASAFSSARRPPSNRSAWAFARGGAAGLTHREQRKREIAGFNFCSWVFAFLDERLPLSATGSSCSRIVVISFLKKSETKPWAAHNSSKNNNKLKNIFNSEIKTSPPGP